MQFPSVVKKVESFFKQNGIWYNISKNTRITDGCGIAASERYRLGHKGIPVFDELRSKFGVYTDTDGNQKKVLVHCRGNFELQLDKIKKILSEDFKKLDDGSITKGLVNPISSTFGEGPILQIYDSQVLEDFYPPYTMMTNAGHFEYAMEFIPKELIQVLPNTQVHSIATNKHLLKFKRHKIGILTGNGPESGMMLWNSINKFVKEKLNKKKGFSFLGDLSYPEVIVSSVPEMGLSMELKLRKDITRKTVLNAVEKLCENNISILCIACNTTQYFKHDIENICKGYHVEYISIPKLVDKYLNQHDISHFDFLGIDEVTSFAEFSAFKALNDKYKIETPSHTQINTVNKLAFEVKEDTGKHIGLDKLRRLIKQSTRTDTVVLALTELSILLASEKKQKSDRKYIDTLSLLAENVAELYVNGIYDILYKTSRSDSHTKH